MTSSVAFAAARAKNNTVPKKLGTGGSGKTRKPQKPGEDAVEKDRLDRDFGAEEEARSTVGLTFIELSVLVGIPVGKGATAANERSKKAIKRSAEETGGDTLTDEEKTANVEVGPPTSGPGGSRKGSPRAGA